MADKFNDDEFIKSLGGTPYSAVKDKKPPEDVDPSLMAPRPETLGGELGQGALQSVLDIPEAIGQGFERPEDPFPIPQTWRNAANQLRQNVNRDPIAQAGEFGGQVGLGLLGEAGLARAGISSLPSLARAAFGAIEGGLSRPVDSPQELIGQMIGGGIAGSIAGRSASSLQALSQANKAAEARAVSTAARSGQADAMEKYQSLNLKRTFDLKKPTAAARAQAGQDYATAAKEARAAQMEAQIAAQAIRMNPNIPHAFWQTIGTLPHFHKMKILFELGKRAPPTAAGSLGGMISESREQ